MTLHLDLSLLSSIVWSTLLDIIIKHSRFYYTESQSSSELSGLRVTVKFRIKSWPAGIPCRIPAAELQGSWLEGAFTPRIRPIRPLRPTPTHTYIRTHAYTHTNRRTARNRCRCRNHRRFTLARVPSPWRTFYLRVAFSSPGSSGLVYVCRLSPLKNAYGFSVD